MFPPPVFLDEAEELVIPSRAGHLRLRVLRPDREPRGVYLHFHGGGWRLGGCDEQDTRLLALANATGLIAASVEYRLAPEHAFPAGPDDCEDAALWLLEHAAAELGAPAWLAVGGESAGGQTDRPDPAPPARPPRDTRGLRCRRVRLRLVRPVA